MGLLPNFSDWSSSPGRKTFPIHFDVHHLPFTSGSRAWDDGDIHSKQVHKVCDCVCSPDSPKPFVHFYGRLTSLRSPKLLCWVILSFMLTEAFSLPHYHLPLPCVRGFANWGLCGGRWPRRQHRTFFAVTIETNSSHPIHFKLSPFYVHPRREAPLHYKWSSCQKNRGILIACTPSASPGTPYKPSLVWLFTCTET